MRLKLAGAHKWGRIASARWRISSIAPSPCARWQFARSLSAIR